MEAIGGFVVATIEGKWLILILFYHFAPPLATFPVDFALTFVDFRLTFG